MKQNSKSATVLKAVIAGAATVLIQFVLIPAISVGWPDALWMALNIILPTVLFMIVFNIQYDLKILLISMITQYVLLIIAASPLSDHLGVSITRPLGVFEYMGVAGLWPIVTTAVQAAVYSIINKIKK